MEITQIHIKKIYNVCRATSAKTGVDVEDLFSECLSKVPNVLKNYDERTGKDFDPYLVASMRGYALNYCRDKSFLSSIGRSDLWLYGVSKRFPNLKLAAECMQIDLSKLEDMHNNIANLRSYSSVEIDKEWMLPHKTKSGNTLDILYSICTQEEVQAAIDFTNNEELSPDRLVLSERAISKIKEYKEELLAT
jgi:RNA polymerase sigma factor (sigma-70 family)